MIHAVWKATEKLQRKDWYDNWIYSITASKASSTKRSKTDEKRSKRNTLDLKRSTMRCHTNVSHPPMIEKVGWRSCCEKFKFILRLWTPPRLNHEPHFAGQWTSPNYIRLQFIWWSSRVLTWFIHARTMLTVDRSPLILDCKNIPQSHWLLADLNFYAIKFGINSHFHANYWTQFPLGNEKALPKNGHASSSMRFYVSCIDPLATSSFLLNMAKKFPSSSWVSKSMSFGGFPSTHWEFKFAIPGVEGNFGTVALWVAKESRWELNSDRGMMMRWRIFTGDILASCDNGGCWQLKETAGDFGERSYDPRDWSLLWRMPGCSEYRKSNKRVGGWWWVEDFIRFIGSEWRWNSAASKVVSAYLFHRVSIQ